MCFIVCYPPCAWERAVTLHRGLVTARGPGSPEALELAKIWTIAGQYEDAIASWNQLLRDFPSSDKVPDARVKKGMALESLGRRSQALLEYRYVLDRYPNAPAARVARQKLNPE